MALFEASHAVYTDNLAAQIEEPVLAGLITHIARDEVRHQEFFVNLVAHCLTYTRDETIAAIAARAAEIDVIGADIDAYARQTAKRRRRRHFRPRSTAPGDL